MRSSGSKSIEKVPNRLNAEQVCSVGNSLAAEPAAESIALIPEIQKPSPGKSARSEHLPLRQAHDIQEEQKDQPVASGAPYIVIDDEIYVEITSSNDPFSSGKNASHEIDIQGASIASSFDQINESLYSLDQADLKEVKRIRQFYSALLDEGDASWAMQRDGLQWPEFKQIESRNDFGDKQEQV